MISEAKSKAANLTCWKGLVDPEPLGGGITNTNFTVEDAGKKYVVRIGEDIPVHGVMRFNELAASKAAHTVGLSPEVIHSEQGVLVLQYIESRTYDAEDIRKPGVLEKIVPMLKKVHHEIPKHLNGPSLVFWVFQVLRSYRGTLRQDGSRIIDQLDRLESIANDLEQGVGPIQLVFGHNDLLPANFLDDGNRLWLLDWDYAGFNSPLFDLSNLASNNEFDEDMERSLLEMYFEKSVDKALWQSYSAMKCSSLLRETMWSMVSEIHSPLDFDFIAYTTENLERIEGVYESYQTNRNS